jgi:hypothetical protein
MRYFHQYTKSAATFLLLTGTTLIQGCSPTELMEFVSSESLTEFIKSKGLVRKFDETARRQIEEYKNTGKFSSSIKMNVRCYNAYSRFSSAHDEATNFAIGKPCSDPDENAENYMGRLFFVTNPSPQNSRIVGVECGTQYYDTSAFGDESFLPRLVDGKFPECPQDSRGNKVVPMYRDYSMPRKNPVLPNREKVVQELDEISNQQVKEFIKNGEYSSTLSFNPECGRYFSSTADGRKTVVNRIMPGYQCNYNEPVPGHINPPDDISLSDFVSAVFAVENKQQRTVTVSRIVCEIESGSIDIIQHPPRLIEGVPVCTTDEDGSGKRILTKQYPPVPMR